MKSIIGLLGLIAVAAGLMACGFTLLFNPLTPEAGEAAVAWLGLSAIGVLAFVAGIE